MDLTDFTFEALKRRALELKMDPETSSTKATLITALTEVAVNAGMTPLELVSGRRTPEVQKAAPVVAASTTVALTQPEPFVVGAMSTDLPARWREWLQGFDFFLRAQASATEDQRISMLIHAAGKDVRRAFVSLKLASDLTYDKVVLALTQHFEPARNKRYERHLFRRCVQSEGESTNDFVTRLRELVATCEFTDEDDALFDQLVEGCLSNALRKKLLEGKERTLADALALARSREVADLQVRTMERSVVGGPSTSAQVSAVSDRGWECWDCSTGHAKGEDCPAAKSHCGGCGRMGHWKSKCRRSASQRSDAGRSNVDGDTSTRARHRRRGDGRQQPRQQRPRQQQQRQVNAVDVEDCDDSDPEAFVMCLTNPKKGSATVSVKLLVEGKPIGFLIDTGASSSLLPRSAVPPQLIRAAPCTSLQTYSGEQVPVVGVAVVRVHNPRTGKTYRLKALVVESGRAVLGLTASEGMHLVRINRHHVSMLEQQSASSRLARLLLKYSDVFGDELGSIKGVTARFELKADARAVFTRARPVALALQDRVCEKIDNMERIGVWRRVKSSEWAAPLVAVPKKDGSIRLCADFKSTINPHLKVDQYPLPVVEDILARAATFPGCSSRSTCPATRSC
jgi:hypothetical protein